MLEQLFGSKTRILLLRLFLNNPGNFFFIREIARNLKLHLNSVRRELSNLESIGIVQSHTKEDLEKEAGKKLKDRKKYYKLNSNFVFLDELRSLLVKAQIIMEHSLAEKVEKIGNVSLFLLSGIFVGRDDAPVDLLVVGTVNRQKFLRLISDFERELGRSINYTIMNKQDFIYRRGLTDRFLYDLLEHKNLKVIDKLKN
jgi:DNA-binding MarR family transcriptional regulator